MDPKNNWWFNGASGKRTDLNLLSKEPEVFDPAKTLNDPLFVMMNPHCSHQRCSYDIRNCDACLEFTRNVLKGMIEKGKNNAAEPA